MSVATAMGPCTFLRSNIYYQAPLSFLTGLSCQPRVEGPRTHGGLICQGAGRGHRRHPAQIRTPELNAESLTVATKVIGGVHPKEAVLAGGTRLAAHMGLAEALAAALWGDRRSPGEVL